MAPYHRAEEDNSDGTGDHHCIPSKLSVPSSSELYLQRDIEWSSAMDLVITGFNKK